jgi:hypothetical protein
MKLVEAIDPKEAAKDSMARKELLGVSPKTDEQYVIDQSRAEFT